MHLSVATARFERSHPAGLYLAEPYVKDTVEFDGDVLSAKGDTSESFHSIRSRGEYPNKSYAAQLSTGKAKNYAHQNDDGKTVLSDQS